MKVLFAGAFPPQEKGEAHYLGRYVSEYRSLFDDSVVVSQYTQHPYTETWNSIPVARLIKDRSAKPNYRPTTELVSATKTVAPDILHLHYGPNADYGGRLGEMLVPALRSIRKSGVKVVLTLHSLWLPDDVKDQAAKLSIPAPLRSGVVGYFGMFQRALRGSVDELLCLVSGPASPMTERFASAYRLRALGEEVHACEPRFDDHIEVSTDPLFFAFGFWRPDKGFDELLRAFSAHVRAGGAGRLLIAGRPQSAQDEPYAKELQEMAAVIGPERCTLEQRFLTDEELEVKLRASHVVVVPYLRNVGASGPLHHALGVGKPVIAADVGHNSALADAVMLYSSEDKAALTNSIRAMSVAQVQRQYAEKSRAAAIERSWGKLARRNHELYRSLLSE